MKNYMLLPALLTAALVGTGCGSLSLGDKVQLDVNLETQQANLTVEMSDGLQINMLNGSYPIGNGTGELVFIPATRSENARIGVRVNLAALAAGQLINIGAISTLPNGAPLPVALSGPLLSIPVIQNANFNVKALVSITPEVQIGAAVGISQLNSRYIPGGISICQNFRNQQNLAFAAICLYGPSATNEMGGIFVGANLGDLFHRDQAPSSAMLMASSSPSSSLTSALSMTSDVSSMIMHDPLSRLKGSNGAKALRNAQRTLSVR